jgi:hypothetical protein
LRNRLMLVLLNGRGDEGALLLNMLGLLLVLLRLLRLLLLSNRSSPPVIRTPSSASRS